MWLGTRGSSELDNWVIAQADRKEARLINRDWRQVCETGMRATLELGTDRYRAEQSRIEYNRCLLCHNVESILSVYWKAPRRQW